MKRECKMSRMYSCYWFRFAVSLLASFVFYMVTIWLIVQILNSHLEKSVPENDVVASEEVACE